MNQARILLVDDDPEHRELCELIFRAKQYEVKCLPDCNNLLDEVASYLPALIVMDHNLPGMTGADGIRILRAHDQFNRIPVIYLSAQPDLKDLASAVNADDYLSKPFKAADLIEKVDRLTSKAA